MRVKGETQETGSRGADKFDVYSVGPKRKTEAGQVPFRARTKIPTPGRKGAERRRRVAAHANILISIRQSTVPF